MTIPEFIFSSILAILSGLTVAVLTHYFSLRREGAVRKSKVVGWLRWLFARLDGIEKKTFYVKDIEGNLP